MTNSKGLGEFESVTCEVSQSETGPVSPLNLCLCLMHSCSVALCFPALTIMFPRGYLSSAIPFFPPFLPLLNHML